MKLASVAALVALSACSGSFGERVHEPFHRSVDAGPSPLVRVDNVAGSVRIVGGSGRSVDVDATKYGSNADELRSIAIGVREEGNTVTIATSYGGGMHRGGVRYRIAVPAGASLRIANVAGAVDVAGVAGDLDVETQAGEITVNAGKVGAHRSIDLRATTGAVTLSVAPGSDASVEAQSTVGDFASDVPGISKTRQNVVGVRGGGRIGAGGGQIRLTTTAGAIALRVR